MRNFSIAIFLLTLLASSFVSQAAQCTDGQSIIQTIVDNFLSTFGQITSFFNMGFNYLTYFMTLESNCSKLHNFGGGIAPGKSMGQVWPLPQSIEQQKQYIAIARNTFQFDYQGPPNCAIMNEAVTRYKDIIFNPPRFASYVGIKDALNPADLVPTASQSIQIMLSGPCESIPYLNMDESYELQVGTSGLPTAALLTARSTWGILRGLESFSQLLYHDNSNEFFCNVTCITDFPRFPFRGFMFDTSRHFISTKIIKTQIDAMAYNKFNVFHWHITDDQSVPYQSTIYPNLSGKGAFNPNLVYTKADIEAVVSYAALRGIRVVPEFDTPGHVQSIGLSMPEIMMNCSTGSVFVSPGLLNPTTELTYTFLTNLYQEISTLFPDKTYHLGGDEVNLDCWSDTTLLPFKISHLIFSNQQLQTYYTNRLIGTIGNLPASKNSIVWQEVYDNSIQSIQTTPTLNKSAIINVWKSNYQAAIPQITASGYQAILSSCWYLSNPSYPMDWTQFYVCEPTSPSQTAQQLALTLGGTGCMWTADIDGSSIIPQTWVRACAIAERLWSSKNTTDINAASPRLEEQRCRMLERGINTNPPRGPNYCPADYLV